MGLESGRREIKRIKAEIAVLSQKQSELYNQLRTLEPIIHKECKHPKIVYTDGHVNHDPDDYDTPEVHICLSCDLTEQGERKYNQPYNFGRTEWYYKILTGIPIRRFCVPGRTPSDTVNYYADMIDRQVKYARERGEVVPGKKRDEMLDKELNKYWFHVETRIMHMSFANRVQAVKKVGYPA